MEAWAEVSGVMSSSCNEDRALVLGCRVRILLSATTGRGVKWKWERASSSREICSVLSAYVRNCGLNTAANRGRISSTCIYKLSQSLTHLVEDLLGLEAVLLQALAHRLGLRVQTLRQELLRVHLHITH